MVRFEDLEKGQDIGSRTVELSRASLVRYAGASGDFNPIHWNERFAQSVGLSGVIAHGMLTMGTAVQLVSDWAGDPGGDCGGSHSSSAAERQNPQHLRYADRH